MSKPLSYMMGSRPPGLLLQLLTALLLILRSAWGESSFIIDTVGLTIQPRRTVQSGTPVKISCQVSVSLSNISHLSHHFQLTRNDVLLQSYNTTEDFVVYELNPARAADSGNYECRVAVKEKSKSSVPQELKVKGLQTPILHLENESPHEHEEFAATCSAPNEKGPLKITYYQRFLNGEPEKMKQLETPGNSSEAILKLRHIGNCFLSCDYEINLISGSIRSNRSAEIQVIVKVLNIKPIMNVLPGQTVFEGDVVEIVCKVVDIRLSNIEVFLKKDKTVLKGSSGAAISYSKTLKEQDSGEYVCVAMWNNVGKENYVTITVQQIYSKPQLTMEPGEIFQGDRFKLTCSISIRAAHKITNESIKFSFFENRTEVTGENGIRRNTYSKENAIQTIAEIHMTATNLQNNYYVCQASAKELHKVSQQLFIEAKVLVSKPVMRVVGGILFLGRDFQLLCHSNRGSLPITYTLHISNKIPEQKVVRKIGERAIFTVPAVFKGSDLNNFQCHSRNGQKKPVMIGTGEELLRSTKIIEPVSRPVLTISPGSDEISEGQTVSLICSVQSGSPPINFTWFHVETNAPLASLSTNKREEVFTIDNVNGENRGRYYCVSTNLAEETKVSPKVTFGVKLAGWKKALIAVFCIVLIMALILIIVFKTRLLQCKRKRSAKLSVKSVNTKTERLSLTQAEVINAANVTPSIMGKSVWSEHVSGSESDDQNSLMIPEKSEPQYTEVQIREADPNKAPVKKGTDTVYSEVRNSQQGVPETVDGASVEYAQLNHDGVHFSENANRGDQNTNDDHTPEIDNSVCNETADYEERACDPLPES